MRGAWAKTLESSLASNGDGHRDAADPAGEPDRDERLAPAVDLELAGIVHRGDAVIGAGELGPVRHVLDASVGIDRLDQDLLRLAGLQPDGGR